MNIGKKGKSAAVAAAIVAILVMGIALVPLLSAQNDDQIPSSKTGVAGNQVTPIMATSSWDPILYTKIKTAEQKDLVIQFTAECALLTDTKIKGKGNEEVSSMDTASVRVRVKIDGELAFPEDVTLCERMQTLKGKLSEWIIETNETTGEPYLVEVSEEIELILNTTSANGFNFLAFNVGSGVHEVVLEADIYINDQPQEGVDESYPTAAVIGDRTLVVDEIRLVQSQTSP